MTLFTRLSVGMGMLGACGISKYRPIKGITDSYHRLGRTALILNELKRSRAPLLVSGYKKEFDTPDCQRIEVFVENFSFFIDRKARINASMNIMGVIMRALSFIYRPVAFFRFSRHSLFMPVELWGFFLFKKWVNRKSRS